LGLNSDTI